MALREFYLGTVGPFYYDDTDTYDDDPAIHHCALRTPQQLYIGTAPIGDKQVVRLEDLVTALIGYIEKALLTEKGDIIYASAVATPAALAHGNAGDVLTSGGHGVDPSWQASSAVPGGADTQVQFNDGGSFGGDAYLIWDKTNHKLCISPDHSYDYGNMAHLENTDINSPDDYYGLVAIFKKTDGASDESNLYIGAQVQMRISDEDKVHGQTWGIYVDTYLELGTIGTVSDKNDLRGIGINFGVVSGQTVNGNVYGLHTNGNVAGTVTGLIYDICAERNSPKIGLLNNTYTNADGGRSSVIDFIGTQTGGEQTVLGRIKAEHAGTSDDEKGELIFFTNDGNDGNSPTERMRIDSAGGIILANVKSGATQVAAGAAANEIWKTASHATLPDNVLMIGV